MAAILFQFEIPASIPSVDAVNKSMVMAMAKSVSPIDVASRQHVIIFWVYIGLLVLTLVFTFLLWWSGNKVQEAIHRDADARIAEATQHAAEATQNAAEANRTAEQERLARIKIEERLAGWRLEPTAEARLLEKLKPHAKTPFDLSVNPVELRFLLVLDRILHQAGWTWHAPKPRNNAFANILLAGKAEVNYSSGITVELAQERWNEFGPAATALIEGLIAEGIPAKGSVVVPGGGLDPTVIHILIGNRE